MTLAGYLSEYSLAEILNFVHQGNRTGLLSITPELTMEVDHSIPQYFLWFESGRIMAITSRLDGKELLATIGRRKLMSPAQIALVKNLQNELPQPLIHYLQSHGSFDVELIGTSLDRISQPLGLYLKSYGLLESEQLNLLFNSQTLTILCKLFELYQGKFEFKPDIVPIKAEMTGISLDSKEAGLIGLRFLKDWSGLNAKLIDPNSAVEQYFSQNTDVRLDKHELKLFNLADGKTSLVQLAEKMNISIKIAQQVSFRLSTFGIIKEVQFDSTPVIDESIAVAVSAAGFKNAPISNSFLGNLKSFLKKGSKKSPKVLTK